MKRETSNLLIAFAAGAVVGGVVALLYAPASGKETREKIKDTIRKAKDKALDEIEQAKEFAGTRKEALKEAFTEGKEAYQRTLKKHAEVTQA